MKMNNLVMATNNVNKLREVREILSPLGIEVLSQSEAGVSCEPDENGVTFAENAMIKAEAVYEACGLPVIADDSGLCVDALDGRPGVHSARYAPKGQECDKLLSEMKDVPEDKRAARFVCNIAFLNGSEKAVFEGKCEGSIGYAQKGTNGFGYDPVFMVGSRTMAELSADEKNAISHRGAALSELFRFLDERYGE